jgi:hypothetical protein
VIHEAVARLSCVRRRPKQRAARGRYLKDPSGERRPSALARGLPGPSPRMAPVQRLAVGTSNRRGGHPPRGRPLNRRSAPGSLASPTSHCTGPATARCN